MAAKKELSLSLQDLASGLDRVLASKRPLTGAQVEDLLDALECLLHGARHTAESSLSETFAFAVKVLRKASHGGPAPSRKLLEALRETCLAEDARLALEARLRT